MKNTIGDDQIGINKNQIHFTSCYVLTHRNIEFN